MVKRGLFRPSGQLVGLTLLLGFVIGCEEKRLVGDVEDNFGRPVAGATVQVDGSGFQTRTDGTGHFELDYAPGQFAVSFSAPDHVPYRQDLSIASAVRYPLQKVVLLKLPPADGLRIKAGDTYVLVRNQVFSTERRLTDRFWNAYCEDVLVPRDIPHLQGAELLAFLPKEGGKPPVLVKASSGRLSSRALHMMASCATSEVKTVDLAWRETGGRLMATFTPDAGIYCLTSLKDHFLTNTVGDSGACFQWGGSTGPGGAGGVPPAAVQAYPANGAPPGPTVALPSGEGAPGVLEVLTPAPQLLGETEILSHLNAIRTAEKAYMHEWGAYHPAARSPARLPAGGQRISFGYTFGDSSQWDLLGWMAPGDVSAQYEVTVVGQKGSSDYGFVARAYADLDNDGKLEIYESDPHTAARRIKNPSPW